MTLSLGRRLGLTKLYIPLYFEAKLYLELLMLEIEGQNLDEDAIESTSLK